VGARGAPLLVNHGARSAPLLVRTCFCGIDLEPQLGCGYVVGVSSLWAAQRFEPAEVDPGAVGLADPVAAHAGRSRQQAASDELFADLHHPTPGTPGHVGDAVDAGPAVAVGVGVVAVGEKSDLLAAGQPSGVEN